MCSSLSPKLVHPAPTLRSHKILSATLPTARPVVAPPETLPEQKYVDVAMCIITQDSRKHVGNHYQNPARRKMCCTHYNIIVGIVTATIL